ncbi:MAG: glycosyltransferase [Prevotella sp.]|nr:glycosyltransferase [Prevotella sp.]
MDFDFWWILFIFDGLLFAAVLLTVAYFTVFTIAAQFKRGTKVTKSKRQNRFIILIPAYKCDNVIERTVNSVLGQIYPQRLFDIVVISDHLQEMTNFKLAQYPITLLTPNFRRSTKGKALQYAINNLPQFKIYDIAMVLDADNLVLPEFLDEINNAYESAGTKAIQAHRVSKNRDTATAILEATFEEINNTIFRQGHISMGLPAAICGSGMAFNYNWFKENIIKTKAEFEEKELEALLMRQHIFVDYFDDIYIFDEKNRASSAFKRKHGQWLTDQLRSLAKNIRYLPGAIYNKQYDLIDKILQWMLIPRTLMMGIILIMSVTLPFIYMSLAIKWWIIASLILLVFAIATPNYLVDKQWDRAFMKIPFVIITSLLHINVLGHRSHR